MFRARLPADSTALAGVLRGTTAPALRRELWRRGELAVHIVGISAFFHDSPAALVRDGEIIAAAREERFTRRKGDARFPEYALRYCPLQRDEILALARNAVFRVYVLHRIQGGLGRI